MDDLVLGEVISKVQCVRFQPTWSDTETEKAVAFSCD